MRFFVLGLGVIGIVAASGFALTARAEGGASAELKEMYTQDQADRLEPEKSQEKRWARITANDKKRHARLMQLLTEGKLHTGDDYYHAAMLMQHGDTARDYMLAHILAMAAAQKGNKPAVWLSAASFDRLMHQVNQPQVFGTQYYKDKTAPWAMTKPMAADLISDSIRKEFDVPTLAVSLKRVDEMNAKK